MKKIISLILSICVVLSTFVSITSSAEEALTEKQTTLLNTIGVLNEEYSLDYKLTRGEFAILLAEAAFPEKPDVSVYKFKQPLTDVEEFSDCYEAVAALYTFNYVSVDKFGRFFPDQAITADEAITMVIRTMGYTKDIVTSIYGTDEALSNIKNINEGMNAAGNSVLDVYSAYNLIYNMLYADISELNEDKSDERIYMSKRLEIYEKYGVVNHDGVVSADKIHQIPKECIEIDGELFYNNSGYCDLFGQSVCAFYTIDKRNSENILLSVCENVRKNKVTTLISKNIEDYKNRTYYYYEDDLHTKDKKIYVPKDVRVIYNEKELRVGDKFYDSMFLPQTARIRLYDNDNDGEVDILRIEDFNVGVVSSVDVDKAKIYINESRIIDLSKKEYVIEYKDGTKLQLDEVSKNNTVLFAESLDGKFVKILLSDTVYTEEVSSYSSKGNGILMTASGGKYELSKYAASQKTQIEMGQMYNFYFDAFDMVALFEKDMASDVAMFGCLATIISPEDIEPEEISVKIYTAYGETQRYFLNKKIKVIHEDDTVKYYKPEELSENVSYRGAIRYKLDMDDKVTSIEIPHAYGTKPDKEDRMFYIVDSHINGNKDDYYTRTSNTSVNYGGEAILDNKTTIFYTPEDPKDYDKYAIGSIASYTHGGKYEMFIFGTDYREKKAECVCMFETYSGTITSTYPWIVTDLALVYDEEIGEAVYSISLVRENGAEATYFMEQEVFTKEIFPIANGITDPVIIEPGDWIYYETQDNYIKKAMLAFDIDQEVTDERGNTVTGATAGTELSYYSAENTLCNPFTISNLSTQNPGSETSWKFYTGNCRIFTGWVYSYEDGYVQITNQNPAYGYDLKKTLADGALTQIYDCPRGMCTEVLGNGKVNVKVFSESDIKSYLDYGADCSRIVFAQYLYDSRCINIINY